VEEAIEWKKVRTDLEETSSSKNLSAEFFFVEDPF
jgi:hypothetical protein